MSSSNPWTLSRFEENSSDLVAPVTARLAAFCQQPPLHARFLNTLSLLEHIGSRKIMVSQTRGPLGRDVLKHLAEEARHAYFFKRAAEKIAGSPLDYSDDDTLAPASARMYFGRLDAAIGRTLGDDAAIEVPYLYISMIIELRAIWVYRLYHRLLAEHQVGLSLNSILAEEELHLREMVSRLDALDSKTAERIPAFAQMEDSLFRPFWRTLDAAAESGAMVYREGQAHRLVH
jgi:hypothetical protein